jgi:HEAT repeat protein
VPHLAPTPLTEWDFLQEPLTVSHWMPELSQSFSLADQEWEVYQHAFEPYEHAMELSQEGLLSMATPFAYEFADEAGGKWSRLRPEQGSPEDSLFRAAREALSRGEYTRASTLFQSFDSRYPRSRAVPSAMYWRAFALYRSGSSDELRAALETLKSRQERFPEANNDPDAATLRTRLYAALAARGDAQAASALRATSATPAGCDREDMEVRAEALNALARLDTPEARPTLKKVLARRDECSVTLRRQAVYILGRNGTEEATGDLLEVAKNDPDAGVRSDAIMLIARSPGTTTVKILEQLFNESTDDRTKSAALSALRSKGGPEARRALRNYIEKSDLNERTRAEAIMQLASSSMGDEGGNKRNPTQPAGDEEDAAFIRGLYAKSESRVVKSAILASIGRMGGPTNDQWLLGIAKNKDEESSLRREALSRIRTSSLTIEELGKLFDAMPERELRYAVVNQLASRDDPAAVDKLIEIVRSGTDPQVRRQALAALTRKNDPRTTKLLLELVEKP